MLIQDRRHYATNQLRTDDHTHTGASPFDNKSASGHPTARIQALAIRQQVNLRTDGRTHIRPIPPPIQLTATI